MPFHTYRTYHPNYLRRKKKDNYIQLLVDKILNQSIEDLRKVLEEQFANICSEISHELNISLQYKISSNFGQIYSGVYFWKGNWEYLSIGFEFEKNDFGEFFFGICKKDITKDIPKDLKTKLSTMLTDYDGKSENWPYWKWFDPKNWHAETFNNIRTGVLKSNFKYYIVELLKKLDGVNC